MSYLNSVRLHKKVRKVQSFIGRCSKNHQHRSLMLRWWTFSSSIWIDFTRFYGLQNQWEEIGQSITMTTRPPFAAYIKMSKAVGQVQTPTSILSHSIRVEHLLGHSCIMAAQQSRNSQYNPLDIPQKYALTATEVKDMDLYQPARRNAAGADVNAVNHGQPVNGPNHPHNMANNGPHAPAAAADGNAGDRSAAGSAPGGTGRQDQRGSSSSSDHQRGSGSSARPSRGCDWRSCHIQFSGWTCT
jgi:hypothetical protein